MDHAVMWLKIAGAIAAVTTFMYGTFVTNDRLKEVAIDRLDRIESKLDRLIEIKR